MIGDAQTSSRICRCCIRAQDRILAGAAEKACPGLLSINPRSPVFTRTVFQTVVGRGLRSYIGHYRSALEPTPSGGPRPRDPSRLSDNPTWAGDGVAGLSGRWVLPGPGRTGGSRPRAGACRAHHARPPAVRRLESRARTGFRGTRAARRLDADLGNVVGRAGARFVGIRSNVAVRPCSCPDRKRRGTCRRPLDVAALDSRRVRRARARGAAHPAAARHVPDRERLPARARLVPAHLLERDGRRLCARGAAGPASDRKWARARHRQGRRGGAAATDRGDAVPDLLARGDLGAAARVRALRPARPAARAADGPAGGGHPGRDRREDRVRQRTAGARRLRHLRGRREPGPPRGAGRAGLRGGRRRAASGGAAAGPADRGDRDRGGQPALPAAGALGRARDRAAAGRDRGRRPAPDLRRPRDLLRGPLHGLLRRPAHAPDVGRGQRADRQLARRAGRLRRPAAARHRGRDVPDHLGRRTARRRRSRSTTGIRCTSRRCPSWGSSGSFCC